jgi:hypothetical protein
MFRPFLGALATVCCVVALWSLPVLAQDLGGRAGRPIERGPANVAFLTQRANVIIHGIVTGRRTEWIGRVIYTLYDVAVHETLKGGPRGSVVVAVPGGARGNVQLTVPGAPSVSIGTQLVVFGIPLDGATLTPVGTFDGLVRVRPGDSGAGQVVEPRGRPESLDAFLDEVRQLVSRP